MTHYLRKFSHLKFHISLWRQEIVAHQRPTIFKNILNNKIPMLTKCGEFTLSNTNVAYQKTSYHYNYHINYIQYSICYVYYTLPYIHSSIGYKNMCIHMYTCILSASNINYLLLFIQQIFIELLGWVRHCKYHIGKKAIVLALIKLIVL